MTTSIDERCVAVGIEAGRAIRHTVYRMTPLERAKVCTSLLKPEAKDRAKHVDAIGEDVGVDYLKALSKQTGFPINLIIDPVARKMHKIYPRLNRKSIYVYFDAIDGTINVAGLGGGQYQANTGNWGTGMTFTRPTDKPLEEITIGDFTSAAIVTGNPRIYTCAPQEVKTVTLDDGNRVSYDSDGRRVFTTRNTVLSQSIVFYEAFQGFDRNTNGFDAQTKTCFDEKFAVALYKYLINRNEHGGFDVKRDYGNISILLASMLGWRDPALPESQGGAFIVINENLPNMLPNVPTVLGSGGIATDLDGKPLVDRKLVEGRTTVVYTANPAMQKQVMECIRRAKEEVL